MYQSEGVQRAISARAFYHIADHYVFHQLKVSIDGMCEPQQLQSTDSRIQRCQAALLVYALDILPSGDKMLRGTAIMERLPTLILALRKFDFIGMRHNVQEEWDTFVEREQIIRLVAWTFSTDCLATLSYNKPPGFSLLEMCGDLPCDSATWDADVSEQRDGSWRLDHQDDRSRCVRDLMRELLAGKLEAKDRGRRLPLFHLHIALCALQHVIYNVHVSMSLSSLSAGSLLQVIETWHHLWTTNIGELSERDRKTLGVAHHVVDIAELSKRILVVADSPMAASSHYLQRVPSSDMRDLHEFIAKFGSPRIGMRETWPARRHGKEADNWNSSRSSPVFNWALELRPL